MILTFIPGQELNRSLNIFLFNFLHNRLSNSSLKVVFLDSLATFALLSLSCYEPN